MRRVSAADNTPNSRPQPDFTLIRKGELARQFGVSTYTLDRWVAAGQFPKPIYTSDAAPARWRVRDVEAWLAKRQVARRKRPAYRGKLIRQMTEAGDASD